MAISGMSVDDWANGTQSAGEAHSQPAAANCHDLVALLKQAPNLFVEELQERINMVGARCRLLARACAYSLCQSGKTPWRDTVRAGSEHFEQCLPQPRNEAVLSSTHRGWNARKRERPLREDYPRGWRLHRPAQCKHIADRSATRSLVYRLLLASGRAGPRGPRRSRLYKPVELHLGRRSISSCARHFSVSRYAMTF